jgi:hypothetical protein
MEFTNYNLMIFRHKKNYKYFIESLIINYKLDILLKNLNIEYKEIV